MSSFIINNSISPGDVIVTPKSALNLVEHYVVYLGADEWGNDIYAENKIGYGVRKIYHSQFASENSSYNRIRRFDGNEYERSAAIERALSLMGTKYNIATFNCEHYANYVQYGSSSSKQTKTVLTLAALAILFWGGSSGTESRR